MELTSCTLLGTPFIGLICIGLIMSPLGPKLLEYNVRFGDPEAQTLLPMLDEESDLAKIMLACTEKRLHQVHMGFLPGYAASVVIAAQGYPSPCRKGDKIMIDTVAKGSFLDTTYKTCVLESILHSIVSVI